MKHTFERTTLMMIFAIIINIGILSCDPQRPVETKRAPSVQPKPISTVQSKPISTAQQWADWVNLQERIGRKVVDAAESRLWLEKHSGEISLPEEIGFMEQHLVMEYPFIGIIITTDHTGKRRIVARQWPLSGPPKEPNFKDIYAKTHTLLSHSESLNWLRRNGYNVNKVANGYSIIRKGSDVYIDYSIMGKGTIIRNVHNNSGNPVTLIYDGSLCIVIPK